MPVEMERMIDMDDPVYSFSEVLRHIDLKKYVVIPFSQGYNFFHNFPLVLHGIP